MRTGGSWETFNGWLYQECVGLQDKLVCNFKLVTDMFSKFVYVADRFGRIVCRCQLIDLGSRLCQWNDIHLCVRRGYGGFLQCKKDHSQYTGIGKLRWKSCNHIYGDMVEDIGTGATERVDRMVNGPILHILTVFFSLLLPTVLCQESSTFLTFHNYTF